MSQQYIKQESSREIFPNFLQRCSIYQLWGQFQLLQRNVRQKSFRGIWCWRPCIPSGYKGYRTSKINIFLLWETIKYSFGLSFPNILKCHCLNLNDKYVRRMFKPTPNWPVRWWLGLTAQMRGNFGRAKCYHSTSQAKAFQTHMVTAACHTDTTGHC